MNKEKLFLIKKEYSYLFWGLLIFKFVLDFVYIFFINKIFAYNHFIVDFNIKKYIYSVVWYIIIYIALPKDSHKPSSVILLLHFMIMILPMFTLYSFINESSKYFNMVCFCFLLECVLINIIPDIKVYKIKQGIYIFYFLVSVITIAVYGTMIIANGIPSLKALNLLSVYQIRENVKYPFLMSYLVGWQAKAINPLMIAVSYKYKKKKTFILFICLQLLLYLITAHKTFILIPIAIIIIMHVFSYKNITSSISYVGIIGSLVSYLVYEIGSSITLASLFIRRFMFLPAQLKYYYYDFTSKSTFLYFSEGVIGKIIKSKYPYNLKFVNLISDIYFNKKDMASNTGYLGTGYANLGFAGMLIYILVFVLVLVIIDSIGKKLDSSLLTGITLFAMLGLNDSDLLTTLLTGGLLFLLLLLYLYAGINENEGEKT